MDILIINEVKIVLIKWSCTSPQIMLTVEHKMVSIF